MKYFVYIKLKDGAGEYEITATDSIEEATDLLSRLLNCLGIESVTVYIEKE